MKKGKKILLFAIANLFLFVTLFSSATWSWLSEGIGSNSNVISSSNFDFGVEVVKDGKNISVVTDSQYGYLVELENSGIYTITIKLTDTSNAQNGYCKISAMKENSSVQNYYKNVVSQGEPSVLTFNVETKEDNVKLLLIPSFGIASTNSFETNEAYLEIKFNE